MSLFSRLFSYRSRDGRDPQEDFFTEAFAGVLQTIPHLRADFVKWLIHHDVDSVHIATQKTLDSENRVDIWIEAEVRSHCGGDKHVIAMENKISADVNIDQLHRYKAQLQHEITAKTRTLVCATHRERASIESSLCEPAVKFRHIYWYEVADWLKEWRLQQSERHCEPGCILINDFTSLMEEWEMEIHLTPVDLAAVTQTRIRNVEGKLQQLLSFVEHESDHPVKLRKSEFSRICDQVTVNNINVGFEFGFDFERDDTDWCVPQLGIPSAYFAIWSPDGSKLTNLLNNLTWSPAPWPSYLRAKQLNSLKLTGTSLHPVYLKFFKDAREELWEALRLCP